VKGLRILGAVLAGGRSERLGADKAGLIVDGEPLWRRQLGVLRAAGAAESVLVRRPGQGAPPDAVCWRDPVDGAGPLGGLLAALRPRAAVWVAVLAVDMPGIDPRWFRWLQGFCRPGVGAMARHAEACEPLAAIYPAEALGEIETRRGSRDHALQRLARALATAGRMSLVPLPAVEAPRARSLNTAAQLECWRRKHPEAAGDAGLSAAGRSVP
jgi:molybdenum cofactor guanylyltransferase